MPSMDDLHPLEAKGLARAKIRSKRRRVSAIRRRTIRGSLALFAIAWAIVFGQLVTGNDPALSRTYGARKLLASTHRGEQAANAPVRPAPESEEESTVVPVESEPAPEVEPEVEEPAPEVESTPEVEVEPEPAPEPAPVITSAS
jgi:outer membrane biosynthesis protein TonB